MEVIFLLIVVSLLLASGFLIAFIYSVKTGQFDDYYTSSVRILFDDKPSFNKKEWKKSSKGKGNK